jgi:NADH-quinone oxidoreductase subunit G
MKIAEIDALDRVLLIGSQIRKEQPLIAARLRRSARKGAQVSMLNLLDDDQLIRTHARIAVAPADLAVAVEQIVRAVAQRKGARVPGTVQGLSGEAAPGAAASAIAESLCGGGNAALLLGNLAQHHPQAQLLHRLAHELAQLAGARLGFLGEAANSVGGWLAGVLPVGEPAGLNARAMLAQPRRAYLLWNTEPELDCHDARQAQAAMRSAQFVVACSPFRHRAAEYAHAMLPIGPFTETAGAFVNTEGRLQSFVGVVRPLMETRPGWKVLRVLGNLLGLQGFDFASAEEVRGRALDGIDIAARLSNVPATAAASAAAAPTSGIQRIAEVPIHFADALARRSEPLQATRDARPPAARMSAALAAQLGVREGDPVRIAQGGGEVTLPVAIDAAVPAGCVRVAAGHPSTSALGELFGAVTVERVPSPQRVPA